MKISFQRKEGKDIVKIYNERTRFTIPLQEYVELWEKPKR